MTDLTAHEILCEVLLRVPILNEVGKEAEAFTHLLAERGWEIAPVGDGERLRAVRALHRTCEGRWAISAEVLGDVLAGDTTIEGLEQI